MNMKPHNGVSSVTGDRLILRGRGDVYRLFGSVSNRNQIFLGMKLNVSKPKIILACCLPAPIHAHNLMNNDWQQAHRRSTIYYT